MLDQIERNSYEAASMKATTRREEVMGAMARGYCYTANENKVLDPDLCNAMTEEVLRLDKNNGGYPFPPAQVIPGLEFEPLWDGIIVEPIIEERSSGGLILVKGAGVDDIQRGKVVGIGPGIYKENGVFVPVPLSLGDVIYRHARTHASKVRIKNPETGKEQEYLMLNCRDVVAVSRKS